ncbi:deoxynucleotide monophosphate kinase [Bacillus phage BSTP3]|nr:deoxynucleotide monophosphate kinase [Bacillus phage BSTP3]
MLLLAIGCIYSLSGWLANRLLARIEEDSVQELIYRQSSQ